MCIKLIRIYFREDRGEKGKCTVRLPAPDQKQLKNRLSGIATINKAGGQGENGCEWFVVAQKKSDNLGEGAALRGEKGKAFHFRK